MKTKPLTYLLSLTFLFLFSGSSVVFGDDFLDATDAYDRKDYETAYKLIAPLAEQGHAKAQFNVGVMYGKGQGVAQDYVLAHMWWNLSGSQGNRDAIRNRNKMERKMSPEQIVQAQEMARKWKPEHLKGVLEKLQEIVGTNE
jgi:hypothetical protein